MNCRFQKTEIAHTGLAAIPSNLIGMDSEDFVKREKVDRVDHLASFFSVLP
jgi:hypothetical protein